MTPGEGLAMTISYVIARSGATKQSQLKADVGYHAEIATSFSGRTRNDSKGVGRNDSEGETRNDRYFLLHYIFYLSYFEI
jgi:hypothetical protein